MADNLLSLPADMETNAVTTSTTTCTKENSLVVSTRVGRNSRHTRVPHCVIVLAVLTIVSLLLGFVVFAANLVPVARGIDIYHHKLPQVPHGMLPQTPISSPVDKIFPGGENINIPILHFPTFPRPTFQPRSGPRSKRTAGRNRISPLNPITLEDTYSQVNYYSGVWLGATVSEEAYYIVMACIGLCGEVFPRVASGREHQKSALQNLNAPLEPY